MKEFGREKEWDLDARIGTAKTWAKMDKDNVYINVYVYVTGVHIRSRKLIHKKNKSFQPDRGD